MSDNQNPSLQQDPASGAGLSGAFGVGSGQGKLGGGSLVERNLNRWTIGFAIAFAVNVVLLLKKPW